MSARTGIEWTDATWTPVTGCQQISPGCAHCYALTEHNRRHAAHLAGKKMAPQYALPFEKVQLQPQRLTEPLSWREGRRIFPCSGADLFHDDVPFEYIATVFAVMSLAERHTFQVLTKRPARMLAFFEWVASEGERLKDHYPKEAWDGTNVVTHHACLAKLDDRFDRALSAVADDAPPAWPLRNVWIGVSVENQRFADERIPILLETPAAVRWLSCEPLLGPVDLTAVYRDPMDETHGISVIGNGELHWVVAGGESGSARYVRPMHTEWVRSLRDQCVAHGVAFLFKQWGSWFPIYDRDVDDPDWRDCAKVEQRSPNGQWLNLAGGMGFHGERVLRVKRMGKKVAGRGLDGRTWDEFPAVRA